MTYCLQFQRLISQYHHKSFYWYTHVVGQWPSVRETSKIPDLTELESNNLTAKWCICGFVSHFCHNTRAGVQASTEAAPESKYIGMSLLSYFSALTGSTSLSLPLKQNSCLETCFGLLPVPLACNASHDVPMKCNQRFTTIFAELPSFLCSEYTWEMCIWNNTDTKLLLIIQWHSIITYICFSL